MNATISESDITLAMRGDELAYRRLVEQSANTVCSIALAIVRNVEASEDVAQEVFLAAWTGMRKLRNPASFLPWLRQVTRNQSHLWLREHRREVFAGDELLAAAVDARPSPADELLRYEERRVLAEVLDELPEDAREVVILYYREQSSVKHVAELLAISEDAVKQRLSRARAKIREEMLRRFGVAAARTAPSAAFATVIAAALTNAAPPAAAAIAGSSGKAATPLLAKASLFGAALGIGGVLLGMKRLEPLFDEREAEELRGFRNTASFVMAIAAIVFAFTAREAPPRWSALAASIVFGAVIWYLYRVRLPKILARRHAVEPADQRETIGNAFGAVCAGAAFMLLFVGRC